jgi:hypothetical protein
MQATTDRNKEIEIAEGDKVTTRKVLRGGKLRGG